MAKKRFTFADAKEKIKALEAQIEKHTVEFDDNVFTNEEVKTLKVYRIGFWILSIVNAALLIALLS